ncbi:MAG TPA: hypothetical protein VK629_04535, partial [Steroidobacteraceae bacterium]|nr:hypothetical protein [Steroidobacteraceae bacterium]
CYAPIDEPIAFVPVTPPMWNWSHMILTDYLSGRDHILGDLPAWADSHQDVMPRSLVAAMGAHGRAEMGRRLHIAD